MSPGEPESRTTIAASELTPELVRSLVFESKEKTHLLAEAHLREEIDAFVAKFQPAILELTLAHPRWPSIQRAEFISLFLHSSLNCLLVCAQFVVSGYHAAAGHQLRSHAEYLAMALLLLRDDHWRAFDAAPERFSADSAVERVLRKSTSQHLQLTLGLSPEGWVDFRDVMKQFNQHSHGGAVSALLHLKLESGGTVLGGEFDSERLDSYRWLLGIATMCAENIRAIAPRIESAVAAIRPGTV